MSRKSRLLERLRELGSDPKRSLGQNFLISDTVIDRILRAATERTAGAAKPSAVLEIGPGLGALTEDLLEFTRAEAIPFRVIELDREFAEAWRGRGLEVTEADALQVDWHSLNLPNGTLLVSNLPYQIAASLVIDRSVEPAGVSQMVLMFQKEVAKRVAARAKSEDYGLLSVIAQIGWKVETVTDAGSQDFHPAPRVSSRVLRFSRRPEAPAASEFADFLRFAKLAYSHRRKLLARNLQGSFALEATQVALTDMKFTKTARAEELSPEELLLLFRRLR